MTQKVAVVTGASSGIGLETAAALASQGMRVVMAVRDTLRGQAAQAEVKRRSESDAVELLMVDFSSQKSIRRGAAELLGRHPAIHVLVNNAGAIFGKREVTVDGLEATFALNHLGYFLFTQLLLGALKAGAPSRVVNVASGAHRYARLNFDDLQSTRWYWDVITYSNSKFANLLFTFELARRLEGTGVTANAVHPGAVSTRFATTTGAFASAFNLFRFLYRTPAKGAQTVIWAATDPELNGKSGHYLWDKKIRRSRRDSLRQENWKRLWEASEALVAGSAA